MADFKVITRGEVNELVPGTFTDDLNKAVLYGELSGNPAFIVNSVNQASGLNYREDQALLGADIQVRSGASILLTIGVNHVLATATTNTFTIVVDNIDVSTLGWYGVGSVGVTACTVDNNNLSGTTDFPENEEYTAKTITVAVSGTSLTGDMVTGVTSFIQGRAEVTPELSIIYNGSDVPASSGETSSFTITKDYVTITNIGVDGGARIVSSGDTGVTIEYPANTGDSRDFTVTVYGTDVYGGSHTDTCTFTQEGDDYEFRLNPSSAAPAATSTSTTVSIISQNVDSIGVSGHTGGVTDVTISGNSLIVEYPVNQDTQEKEMTVTLTGVTTGGRVVPVTLPITQGAAGQIIFTITYNGGTVDSSSGETSDFTIGIAEATITGFTVPEGCSYETGTTPTLTFAYPKNTDENSGKTYTIVMEGTNTFGEYVSASTEVTQSADSYVFNLSPVSNPIAASASTAAFNLTGTSVSGIGYYLAQSQNIDGISGLSSNSVTATGITPNSGSTDKDIVLVLSGKTNAGRTVYATGTTSQSYSRTSFGFDDEPTVSWSDTSVTIDFSYDYLVSDTIVIKSTPGAYFDTGLTTTSITVNVTSGTSGGSGSVTVYFPQNDTDSQKEYEIYSDVRGEAGENVEGNTNITQKPLRKVHVEPSGTETSETSGNIEFTVSWENLDMADVINLSPFNVTLTASTFTVTSICGSTIIVANKTANTGDRRNLELTASTFNCPSDTGYYVQRAPAGKINVTIGSRERHVTGDSGRNSFDVYWTGLTVGSQITLSGSTGMSSISPASISVSSVDGSGVVSFNYSAYSVDYSDRRNLKLTATGTDRNGDSKSDNDYFTQYDVWTFRNTRFNDAVAAGSETSLSLDAEETSGYYYAVQDRYVNGEFDGYINDTYVPGVVYKLYSGTTQSTCNTLIEISSYISGDLFKNAYLTVSGSGGSTANAKLFFKSTNTTSTSPRYFRITVTDDTAESGKTGEMLITVAAYVPSYNPDIWWTKTSGGASSTAVSSVSDIPAYVPNTYDGRNVTYTIYINYNNDVSGVSMDTSHLTNSASASRSGKTVTITAPANSGSSRSLGYITVTGTAPDGTTDTATLTITQVAGSGVSLLIEGRSTYTASTISYSGGQATYNYTSSNVGNIGTGTTSGAATGSTLSSSALTVKFSENSSATSRSWEAPITGRTVFGNVITAKAVGTQEAAPGYSPDIWWTKTSGETVKVTATTVSAYTPNSYTTAATVQHVIYINYNNDVTGVSMDTSHLTNGTSASRNGKTVTITAPTNSGSTRSLGYMTVTGTAPDGTTASATLTITQAAGGDISPYLRIEGVSSYTDTVNIPYSGEQRTHIFSYDYVGAIGTSGLTNASGATANTSTNILTVGVMENTGSIRSWGATVTGITVFGNIIKATIVGTQDAAPNKLYLDALTVEVDNHDGSNSYTLNSSFSLDIGRTYVIPTITVGANDTETGETASLTPYTYTSTGVTVYLTSFSIRFNKSIPSQYVIQAKVPGYANTIDLMREGGDDRNFSFSGNLKIGEFNANQNHYPTTTTQKVSIQIWQGVQ